MATLLSKNSLSITNKRLPALAMIPALSGVVVPRPVKVFVLNDTSSEELIDAPMRLSVNVLPVKSTKLDSLLTVAAVSNPVKLLFLTFTLSCPEMLMPLALVTFCFLSLARTSKLSKTASLEAMMTTVPSGCVPIKTGLSPFLLLIPCNVISLSTVMFSRNVPE